MIRKAFSLIAISLLLCIVGQTVYAQTADTPGTGIHGYVTSLNNTSIPGATVNLFKEGASPTTPTLTTQTDSGGFYAFSNLQPGNYSISASKDFYVYTMSANLSEGNQTLNLLLPLPS
ncbi:carboxypeptidase-like regulatory domain-containing protein [Methanocella arvoryzae]|uniref:carboxypeptidase-like regulatory domain-containing protein n=1 Tax=Methanocella arvoryzae TaxID=1175445 RepID=UPI000325451E|nr:carboxypeptidase-like regulatory domain-containing protein [Methanocella arvoryzae]